MKGDPIRVFVYEHLTAGDRCAEPPLPASLLREGAAMITALAADLVACRIEVLALRDSRCQWLQLPGCQTTEVHGSKQARNAFSQLAHAADWTLVIAPEFGGILLDRCRHAEATGRLLSPGSELVSLASDKHQTALQLARAGIPVPAAILLQPGARLPADFSYPAVLKPCDGAGSLGVQLVAHADAVAEPLAGSAMRLERYCPGTAASVSVLCGPGGAVALPACRQRLSAEGRFQYLGGETPLPRSLARRASQLALAAVRALPPATGYVGVDLVLGPDSDGQADVVIEVNPRLTTSYLGLRRLARVNLARAMLEIARGGGCELSFDEHPIQFDAFIHESRKLV